MRDAEADSRQADRSNLRLRKYYESQGLEFVGTVDIGSGIVSGSGVRWRDPRSPVRPPDEHMQYRSNGAEFALGAARAFLDITAKEAAAELGLNRQTLTKIEASGECSPEVRRKIVEFYRTHGIVFVGWRDEENDRYFGVGVMTTKQILPKSSDTG
ncbi:helix-turn-helix domain-containing protein [Shinella zoogloeoides]|uniref:helix-turn-helix domain-containing protein n=1 Tax=Shinella zoogloeoides TaxID=352475 RepID=UPI001F5A9B4A|nr:helix-turn-helix transcriptional regulator [Shinella zoogloeoides]